MNATTTTLSTYKRSLAAALIGGTAVLMSLATPAETARAALRTIQVDGVPVTVTQVNTHNWSTLGPNNADNIKLKDGSRGEFWTFDVKPGQCLTITMTSDDFHPYLLFRKGAPDGEQLASDNGKADNWAKISGTVAGDDEYYLLATSSGFGEHRGKYNLDVDEC
jgi:hypothetical protein